MALAVGVGCDVQGVALSGPVLVLEPHGQVFEQPVTLTIGYDKDPSLPAYRYEVLRLDDEKDSSWERVGPVPGG